MGGLRWTRRSTVKLAAELAREGFALSKTTACRWLKQERFSLRVNRKCLARAQQAHEGGPVISTDFHCRKRPLNWEAKGPLPEVAATSGWPRR